MQIPLVGDLHDSLQQEVLKRGSEVELLNLAIIDGMNAKREKEVRLISDKLVEDLNDIIQQSSSIQRQETENLNKQLEQWQQIIEVEYDNDSKA